MNARELTEEEKNNLDNKKNLHRKLIKRIQKLSKQKKKD
jgi:hypothetical protein